MFSSPCSLRSAQCATLIALAAAAGISRFEPALENTATPDPAVNATASAPARTVSRAQLFYLAVFRALAPQPCLSITGIDLDRASGAQLDLLAAEPVDSTRAAPPTVIATVAFFPPPAPALSARQHSYPYAVGPPARGVVPPLRAAGLARPGDSSARRSSVFRIAPGARIDGTTDSGPKLAGSLSLRGSALRAGRDPADSAARNFLLS